VSPAERLARCEAVVIAYEGGAAYTNNPKDRGGPTRFGVTLAALSEWRGHPCTPGAVQALSEAEAREIYRGKYWDAVRGDRLPAGVDLITFDAAVNCGRGRAAELLQRAARMSTIDRAIGPVTLAAVAAMPAPELVEAIRQGRALYYRGLDDFPTFGRGWLRRLEGVAVTAAAWAKRPD
jgi:lysozyme family protein